MITRARVHCVTSQDIVSLSSQSERAKIDSIHKGVSLFLSYTNMNQMNSLHHVNQSKISNFLQFESFKVRAIYSGRRRRVIKWVRIFFFVVLVLPILHFGRWLVRGTFAVCSSHVRPVNQNKWRRAIWNINAYAYKCHIFSPCGVNQFSLVCLYFIANFRPKHF